MEPRVVAVVPQGGEDPRVGPQREQAGPQVFATAGEGPRLGDGRAVLLPAQALAHGQKASLVVEPGMRWSGPVIDRFGRRDRGIAGMSWVA